MLRQVIPLVVTIHPMRQQVIEIMGPQHQQQLILLYIIRHIHQHTIPPQDRIIILQRGIPQQWDILRHRIIVLIAPVKNMNVH